MRAAKGKRWIPFVVFVVPALLIYTYFMIFSIGNTGYYSLTQWNAISEPKYIGMKYYMDFLKDKDFRMVLKNSLLNVAISLIVQIPAGLIGGYLLYRTRRCYRLYRFLIFIPVVLSASAVALLFTLIFHSEFGPVNLFLEYMGLGSLTHSWLSDVKVVFYGALCDHTAVRYAVYSGRCDRERDN